jgi:hypothetical protein
MKIYHYILFFLFLAVICRVYYLYFRRGQQPQPVKNRIIEGFGFGYESLDNCLDQGYPDDFCKRAPLEACIQNCPVGTFMPKKFNVF